MRPRLAIVGCGLVGGKRALGRAGCPLTVCADTDRARAERLAAEHPGCRAVFDWRSAIAAEDVDLVIVATSNDALVPVSVAAAEAGKHVLVEKPAARSTQELALLEAAAARSGVQVKVGFNHRFHPGLALARQRVEAGAVGPLLYVRGRYGHGGRPGYEKEWRARPEISGGGEMLDQGVHLIDLARWFLGDFDEVSGYVATFFWDMPVEDNGFALLRTPAGQIAMLHASWTEWKNLFCFEIFGRDGKLMVEGLGGSYGSERLTEYRMLPGMGPPEVTAHEFSSPDESWALELDHFVRCIERGEAPEGSLADARAALEIVERLYRASRVT